MLELDAIRTEAARIALEAGAALMEIFGKPHDEQIKTGIWDIVTEADKASEAVIIAALRAAFPTHGIISEEDGVSDAPTQYDYAWHIDPVDGTSNYNRHLPHFCVSIGLADAELNPLVGVIYAPFHDELFSAARGMGATLNGEPIHVSDNAEIGRAIMVSGFAPKAKRAEDFARFTAVASQVRAIRVMGAAALDMCYVAMGRTDGVWEGGIHSWDVMAGCLIVQEAGGCVTDFSGQSGLHVYQGEQVLATSGQFHDEIVSIFASTAQNSKTGSIFS